MKGLNRYLLYGDVNPIDYSPSRIVIPYDWDEARELLREKLIKSLGNIKSSHLSFCGTTSGLILRDLLGDSISKLWVFDGINIDHLFDRSSVYAKFDLDKIENDLITINSISETPRCSMEDLFAFHRQKCIKNETDLVYCEGGTDFLFLGFNIIGSIMRSFFRQRKYNITSAMKYLEGPAHLTELASHLPHIYEKIFRDNFFYFTYDELEEFGIVPPDNILDTINQSTFMASFFDLGYHMVYKTRTKLFGDYFGLEIYSPFYNDPEFVTFCLTIPMEMKYCVGRKKHILKEAFDLSKYKKFPHIDLERNLFNYIKPEIGRLAQKYLTDKSKKIFEYLPFDIVQKYIEPDNKKTIVLLNLAMWLEVHEC